MNQAHLPVEIRADKIAVLSLIPNPSKPRGGVVVHHRARAPDLFLQIREPHATRSQPKRLCERTRRTFSRRALQSERSNAQQNGDRCLGSKHVFSSTSGRGPVESGGWGEWALV